VAELDPAAEAVRVAVISLVDAPEGVCQRGAVHDLVGVGHEHAEQCAGLAAARPLTA